MLLYTVDRKYARQIVIDSFHSAIWTQRYYGDSEVELVVPTNVGNAQALTPGTFLALQGTQELMILETQNFTKDGKLKVTGISILKWLNNRFIRTSPKHEDRYWTIENMAPGQIIWHIVYYMCTAGSKYLNGTVNTGIPNPQQFIVPGMDILGYDSSGDKVTIAVPYGPVFDAIYEIATTHEIGQYLWLINAEGNPFRLGYRNYKGLDRTSSQSVNPPVRFSSQFDSLTDIEEVQSISNYKTQVYAFAPGLDEKSKPLATTPGMDTRVSPSALNSGFDIRAQMIFAEDITTDQIAANPATLLSILNGRAKDALANTEYVQVVDGEIVPTAQFKYGRDYNLGDVIEIQGNSGVISKARVTEYIRIHDEAGERAYPTVTVKK